MMGEGELFSAQEWKNKETRRRLTNMVRGRLPRDNGSCECEVYQTCAKCRNPRGEEVPNTMTKTKLTAKKTGKKAIKAVKKVKR